MIKINYNKTEKGIEIDIGNNEVNDGIKIVVLNEDLPKLEESLPAIFKMAEDYLNANYVSMHERRQKRNYYENKDGKPAELRPAEQSLQNLG